MLAFLTLLNIVGLGVGKWLNNLGAIGTFIAAAVLIGLGLTVWSRFGTTVTAADFRIPADPKFVLNSFGVICFGLVGLELASVMGDEIREPQKTLPGAVAWGGVISGALYIGATLTLLVAIGKNDISVLQGIVQAVSHMAAKVGVAWIIAPFAVMLSLSIAGIGSAWMGGSARIPFVAGLDSYMPQCDGQSSPEICDSARGIDRAGNCFAGPDGVRTSTVSAACRKRFRRCSRSRSCLQLIPFLYVFAALMKFALRRPGRWTLWARHADVSLVSPGFSLRLLAIVVAFFPAKQITSIWKYEVKMFGITSWFHCCSRYFSFMATAA